MDDLTIIANSLTQNDEATIELGDSDINNEKMYILCMCAYKNM